MYISRSVMFRSLSDAEEATVRKWPHENVEEMQKAVTNNTVGIYHPVIRNEWFNMILRGEVGGRFVDHAYHLDEMYVDLGGEA